MSERKGIDIKMRDFSSKRKKDILVIAHFSFNPGAEKKVNSRFYSIVSMLPKNQYKVELVTSSFDHTSKRQKNYSKQEIDSFEFKYTSIYEPGYSKNVCIRRFYSHYVMGVNLNKYLKNREMPDIIYCSIPSNSVASVAAAYAKRNKIRFIIDVQDLWPEAFKMVFNIPILSNIIFAPMIMKANIAYKQADAVIAVSDTYKNRALKVNNKCKLGYTVFLGTSLKKFDYAVEDKKRKRNDSEVWLAYCGTLGHSYDLRCVMDALSILKKRGYNRIRFVVMGDGPLRIMFEKYSNRKQIKVDFLGLLDYSEMCAVLSACDIAINPIIHRAAQSIINKHGDYAAAGIPVINTQENEEYRRLIEQYNMGFNCENGNAGEIADRIEELINSEKLRISMGKNARLCAEEKFDRDVTYQAIVDVIDME